MAKIRISNLEIGILSILTAFLLVAIMYGASSRSRVVAAQPNMRFEMIFYEAHAKPDIQFEIWRDKQTGQIFTCTKGGYGITPCVLTGTSTPDKTK